MSSELNFEKVIKFLQETGYAIVPDCKECAGKGYFECGESYCDGIPNQFRHEYDSHQCWVKKCESCEGRRKFLQLAYKLCSIEEKLVSLENNSE